MTTNEKLLISTSLLPVLADFLEDAGFRHRAKEKANLVTNAIRSLDKFLLDGAKIDEYDQQINIQLAFRQWCAENFKDENN